MQADIASLLTTKVEFDNVQRRLTELQNAGRQLGDDARACEELLNARKETHFSESIYRVPHLRKPSVCQRVRFCEEERATAKRVSVSSAKRRAILRCDPSDPGARLPQMGKSIRWPQDGGGGGDAEKTFEDHRSGKSVARQRPANAPSDLPAGAIFPRNA